MLMTLWSCLSALCLQMGLHLRLGKLSEHVEGWAIIVGVRGLESAVQGSF